MNEHELEPTVVIPRVVVPPRAGNAAPHRPYPDPAEPIAVAPPIAATPAGPERRPYVFGNPFAYAARRFAAFALDFGVISAVATMLLYGLIAINPLTGLPNNSEGGFDATLGLGVATALVAVWLLESIFGTTLGKLAFSLHVYAPRHRFVGFGRALIRNILRPLDLLVIGWILAMAPGHRRLGDLFGGTVVAHSPLRAFSPLVGWVLVIALGALPFVIAGGSVTVFAVVAAFIEFVPPLLVRALGTVAGVFGSFGVHLPR